jgi:L-threonylcarbamoyladenylate synthase
MELTEATVDQVKLKAAEIVRRGGLIAFRTDTFYGLGADPLNARAVRRIFELKGREEGKPILVLISDLELVSSFLTNTSAQFSQVAKRFWPGPLTLVGVARDELPRQVTAGTGTVGIRLPADEEVRALLRACGGALTATSANPAGQPPARSAEEVGRYFPDGIDLIVDEGEVSATQPSTVLDLSGDVPRLIREGAVSRAQLQIPTE